LFDKKARTVSFAPTTAYSAALTGNPVFIDGVAVTGSTSVMPLKAGKIAGLAELRDKAAVIYQDQLDEIARGLINAFAESDQRAVPLLPDVPGLFTSAGFPPMPVPATVLVGLAGTISVAASVDPAVGGNVNLLRDGGISGGPAYVYNTGSFPGFSTRLHQLVDQMNLSQPFDPAAQGKPSASIIDFAASSVSYIESRRQDVNAKVQFQDTLLDRSNSALSNVNGVNMDDEMSLMLQVERTFGASSKLITTIDSMMKELLAAV
jgi:flagellar hook-associated protein 1 FlgK